MHIFNHTLALSNLAAINATGVQLMDSYSVLHILACHFILHHIGSRLCPDRIARIRITMVNKSGSMTHNSRVSCTGIFV